MLGFKHLKTALKGTAAIFAVIQAAHAGNFDIPSGDLKAALTAYTNQAGVQLLFSGEAVQGLRTKGVKGALSSDEALSRILSGTGFTAHREEGAIAIVPDERSANITPMQLAQAAPARAAVETVTVTSSKLGGADVQSIPIAITALSQEQLQAMKVEGGPDLLKEIPNMTFTKTNFTSYNIQIRGIGTQAISVTTDPAVAVAFNDMPFIRNHLFEQEFFDVGQVEVLRGPQGTLYGRNAIAGVVNVISARPTDQWEAMAKVETGNYNTRRLVGTLNVPVLDDRFDIRVAGAWTKRDGYSFNETTGKPIDGRDLWSARLTLGYKPIQQMQIYAIWEHFQEDDDRVRSAKQLCKKDPGPDTVDGFDINSLGNADPSHVTGTPYYHAFLSQGCLPTSLYSPEAFQTPNGQALPFIFAGAFVFNALGSPDVNNGLLIRQTDPYSSAVQSRNLRVIQSELTPTYKAKADVVQLNMDYDINSTLKLTSQTGYDRDQLASTEDFNRFNTAPGIFAPPGLIPGFYRTPIEPDGMYCDPQLGCSDKLVGEDLSRERAWQLNQEVRLASNFSGPFNFSAGANFTHYETNEDYFVFFNVLSALVQTSNNAGPGDFNHCYSLSLGRVHVLAPIPYYLNGAAQPSNFGCSPDNTIPGTYMDPNPIGSVDGNGHNYFRSENPYHLTSYAAFGEAYYNILPDVKLIAGLRWTDDQKKFWNIPSWVFAMGGGYPVTDIVDQQWKEWTGRFNVNWTPKVDFTDQTLIYASYSRGYKGGGANPPAQVVNRFSPQSFITHPATFEPEFVNAFELGTKNSLADNSITLNGDVFFYDYKGYQISQIIDRTSINLNFDAKVHGLELESTWEPIPGLRFNFAGGYESSSVNKGQSAIDLIDRTAGHEGWLVVKPFVVDTSNCILPAYVIREMAQQASGIPRVPLASSNICDAAYAPPGGGSILGYTLDGLGITDFDPSTAPNNGAGFAKDLSGNELPNTPHFTVSFGAQFAMPLNEDWTSVVRTDAYWQSSSYARIFNDKPYDQLRGWTNVNFSLMFVNSDGWGVEGYIKNVFDTAAITGAFLNSDDTALTTNVFVTDPRLIGLNITKNW